MDNLAIQVEGLSKKYKLYENPRDRLKEALNPFGKKFHKDFYALDNINLQIKRGDTLGILGKNGSGKSTLLQIVAGVLTPSDGRVVVNGRVSALLELGAGFNPEFTGIENIYMQGTLMGFSKDEMDARLDTILSFADIGVFAQHPVKTYSSGMFVRLAFSVATQIEPEILIIDEALSVGDMFFQAKCITKMHEMIDNEGVTLLFVSHDLATVKALCNSGIVIENGQLTFHGNAADAAGHYFATSIHQQQGHDAEQLENTKTDQEPTGITEESRVIDANHPERLFDTNKRFEETASFQRVQNGKAAFTRVLMLNCDGKEIQLVEYGQEVTLRMAVKVYEDISTLGIGYRITNNKGISIVGSNSELESKNYLRDIQKDSCYIIDWTFTVLLSPGPYSVSSTCYIPIDMRNYTAEYCDIIPISFQFSMSSRVDCNLNALTYWGNRLVIEKHM